MRVARIAAKEKKTLEILDKFTALNFEIARWSGFSDLRDEKKPGAFKRLYFCPPEEMGFYFRIRNRITDLWLQRVGLKCLENWLIPESLMESTHNYFCEMEEDYRRHVEKFMSKYSGYIKAWQLKQPKLAHIVDHPRFSEENVMNKFRLKWYFFKIVPASGYLLRQDFIDEIDGLELKLYSEVAEIAETLWETIYANRVKIVSRTAGPIKVIKAKLEGLIFLSPIISSTVRIIDAAILDLPFKLSNKTIPPETIENIRKLLWILKDIERCYTASQAADAGQPVLSILNEVDL